MIALREATAQTLPVGGGLYINNILDADDLDNEETWSVEAGYSGTLAEGLTLGIDTYYQRFGKLIGYRRQTNMFGMTEYTADHINGADSWGAEAELALKGQSGAVSVWYAYNGFKADRDDEMTRAYLPAMHKAGVTGRLFLPDNWTFNINYRFTDTSFSGPSEASGVSSSHRLDPTISKSFAGGKGEVMLGVSDLLKTTHDPVHMSGAFTAHETPGRTFFLRLQFAF